MTAGAEMHHQFAYALAITLALACPAPAQSYTVPAGYVLVWADEFNISGLPDPAKWGYDTEANATGWYNNELQYYAATRAENARVDQGHLIITARHESLTTAADYGGQAYSSARLLTRDTASWTYGFFDIRAKLPCGGGTWPAIWALGTADVAHPAMGEIDIMEQVGNNPTSIEATIYTSDTSAALGGISSATEITDACTDFHNYHLTWTAESLVIGVDNKDYFAYANPKTGQAAWPFDAPQYLLLNLAIGGDMGGAVNNAIFPAALEIDYVRVYQKP
jgi:beta-glucanase (GH16 family)